MKWPAGRPDPACCIHCIDLNRSCNTQPLPHIPLLYRYCICTLYSVYTHLTQGPIPRAQYDRRYALDHLLDTEPYMAHKILHIPGLNPSLHTPLTTANLHHTPSHFTTHLIPTHHPPQLSCQWNPSPHTCHFSPCHTPLGLNTPSAHSWHWNPRHTPENTYSILYVHIATTPTTWYYSASATTDHISTHIMHNTLPLGCLQSSRFLQTTNSSVHL
jgi:hypothetical protein